VNGFSQVLQGLGASRALVLLLVAATVMGLLGYFGTRLTQPPMTILYGDLETTDSGQIITKLEAMGVPYELRGGGTQIFVPTEKALRLRMAMAQEGLPNGGSVGYEVFDRADTLGSTRTVQNINLLRALEGELERTIRSISQIAAARVHLVMPKRDLFSRDQPDTSASIVIEMSGGNRLNKIQVEAIRHLVASAVTDLKPGQVSIVDNRGNLLARGGDEPNDGGVAAAASQDYRGALESRTKRIIEELLEQSVGIGKVRAEVSAEIDFDRITTNAESFDPESQVIRSSQVVEESDNSAESDGAQTVSIGDNLPENEETVQAVARNVNTSERIEETINYEISKTISTHVRESGNVTRLSVAVLVDGTYTENAEGVAEYQARSEEELEKYNALVRSAVGFSAERGDTIEVVNMQFVRFEALEAEEPPLVDLGKGDYFKIAEIAVMFVVAILIVLLVLRPLAIRALGGGSPVVAEVDGDDQMALPSPGQAPAQIAPGADGAPEGGPISSQLESSINVANVEGQMKVSSMKRVGEIVDNHPDEALNIIRNWLHQDA
jgi:flagellar M-ring protein FliF